MRGPGSRERTDDRAPAAPTSPGGSWGGSSGSSSGGSSGGDFLTDGHTVVPATGARTGPALTHDSRPALRAPVPGRITGATAVSTGRSVELIAPAPGGALGSAYSLALTGSGTHSPRVRSGEAGSAAYRPQLESHLRS
ncbi:MULTISPECIES: hypothetical protein [unclassified Streptomyces]|uniref:hypothetical protein n=1 Tax=unclassified Streptomyces TaxID=2593676 RepID=UPI00344D7ABD